MRVNHGRFQILAARKVLNRSNIIPVLDQEDRVAKGVTGLKKIETPGFARP